MEEDLKGPGVGIVVTLDYWGPHKKITVMKDSPEHYIYKNLERYLNLSPGFLTN